MASTTSAPTPVEEITRDLPMQTRAGEILPGSFDEAAGTIEVVWTTGARGVRYDWWEDEYYDEELVVDDSAVDMTRFDAGVVQALDSHRIYSGTDAVLGIATRGWLDGGLGHSTVKLSVDPAKAGKVADIRAGVIRSISVGYTVQRYERTEPEARTDGVGRPLLRATRWTPHEISFVTVPFDTGASTRSASPDTVEGHAREVRSTCFITRSAAGRHHPQEVIRMDDDKSTGAAPAGTIPPAAAGTESIAVERQRSTDILTLCRDAGVPDQADALIRDGLSVEAAGLRILRARADTDRAAGGHTNVQTTRDEIETRQRGIEEAVLHRLDGRTKLTDNGRQFRGMSMIEIGRDYLESQGVRTRGMDRMTLAGNILQMRSAPGYMGTSDFGSIMSSVANKRLRGAYEAMAITYTIWAKRAPNAPDFRSINVMQLSTGPELEDVNEAGEFRYGAYTDSGMSYKVATGGKIVSLTRQLLVNDDVRAFDRIVTDFGAAAARRENRMVYSKLLGQPLMSDNVALFHADHANLKTGAGSALTIDGLRAARMAMRKQTAFAAKGETPAMLNLAPRYLLVPTDLETQGAILTSANYQPTKREDTNEFSAGQRHSLEMVCDPLMDSAPAAWYLLADAAGVDTVEYCYLDGAEGPVIEQRMGFEVDGLEMKCRHDFAAAAIDWRGMVKNLGA